VTVDLATSLAQYEVDSPAWWLRRLEDELSLRITIMQAYRDLVDDVHQRPDSVETSQKFRRIAGLATTNLTGLAVEATAERMSVEGVRIGDEPDADKGVWDNIWQRSDFDEGSQLAITSALVYSRSFISVEPPSATSPNARLHYEDPRQVVLSSWPDGTRRAALKMFTDAWTGTTFGTLYTPGWVVKMERRGVPGQNPYWVPRDLGRESAIARNPLGEVPFFELKNMLTGSVRSELAPLVVPQLRLNQIVFNTDAVAEYGAFRQKWVTNIEIPRDAAGNPWPRSRRTSPSCSPPRATRSSVTSTSPT
jgi:hypothetical protein